MPESFEVFKFDLGPVDLLLAAGDFYAVASRAECRLPVPGDELQGSLETKGRAHRIHRLEDSLAARLEASLPPDPEAFAAFLARFPDGTLWAFTIERPFEMQPVGRQEFRLFPEGIKRRLARLGLIALRFSPEGRFQILASPAVLARSATAGTDAQGGIGA